MNMQQPMPSQMRWERLGSSLHALLEWGQTKPSQDFCHSVSCRFRRSWSTGHRAFEQLQHMLLFRRTPPCIGVSLPCFHNCSVFDYISTDLSILRGCLGYGGVAVRYNSVTKIKWHWWLVPQLVKHKEQILVLLLLLIDKTKSERGYTGTGRLITRMLQTLTSVYPLNSRFVNTAEWDDPGTFA